jgi:transposase
MAQRGRPKVRVELSVGDRAALERLVRASTTPQRDVLRARIILACSAGEDAGDIAERLGIHLRTVELWRRRFLRAGLDGLKDLPRSGPKPKFDSVTRLEIIKLACEPVQIGDSLFRRTIDELQQELVSRNIVPCIGWGTIQGILARADLRPHQTDGWLHSPDPNFREKVTEICELYQSKPDDGVVLSIDEKTGMQAIERRFPDRLPAPGRIRRREFEYKRHGTQSLFACFDVHTGKVVADCRDNRKADDLVAFMEQVAREYPQGKVHVIWDNLNIHYDGSDMRWTKFNERHGDRFHLHYTPKHASWVNQIELFFSIVQRRCLRDGNFKCTKDLHDAVMAFIARWNTDRAKPFKWTFTGYPLQIGAEAA